jgi:hypothetical protein
VSDTTKFNRRSTAGKKNLAQLKYYLAYPVYLL